MLRIHERLKGGQLPNCSQLAVELEVSAKTIQRDVDFMRDRLDLPIEFDRQANGFRYTAPVENFPTVQVTEGELVALFVAGKAMAQYRGTPFEKPLRAAFEKLTSGLSDRVSFSWRDAQSAISFRTIGATHADLKLLEAVSQAVLHSQEMAFDYHKLGGAGYEQRRAQPYHLGCVENQWYLFAFDLDRRQMRTFVLARMRNIRNTGKAFVRPASFSAADYLGSALGVFTGKSPIVIRIRFDAFAARLVRERQWHPSQKLKKLAGGEIELTLKLASLPEVFRWVLSWGEHARVLAPEELRRQVRQAAEKMAGFYAQAHADQQAKD
jgi:proteasome accessory factor B